MRTYLVIIDESQEAGTALRFAARRATRTGGAVEVLALIPRPEFVAWGGVQSAIEDEARAHAETMVRNAITTLALENVVTPTIKVKQGEPIQLIRETLAENPEIGALVLGAARDGPPGPLIAHFAGADAGALPCPIMIVPGSLSNEALDRLS